MPDEAKTASLAAIQADIGEWSMRNFGVTTIIGDLPGLLRIMKSVGVIAHGMLKVSQNIRGEPDKHLNAIANEMPALRAAVSQLAYWSKKPNTNIDGLSAAPFLGAIEEIGEMIEAVLDKNLSERERQALLEDGYADLLVFWLDLAHRTPIDAEAALNRVWAKVRQRNWKKDAVSGGEPS